MSGTAANASVWANADVFIAPVGTAIPADESTAFGAGWDQVGLLDGAAGFEYSRSEDKKDHYAWGGILIATTRKNHKSMYKFTALEDNAVTRSLVWPGSTATELKVPVVVPLMVAFETTTGGKVKRMISKNYVEIELNGSIKDGEEDLTSRTFDVTVFPDDDGVLFDVQSAPEIESIAITPLTLALAPDEIGVLVATATYTDASTGVITGKAAWTTENAAEATVAYGYVTAVDDGTPEVTCSFGGITATAPCVVTVATP